MTFGDGGRRFDPSSEKVPDPQEGDQLTPEYQNTGYFFYTGPPQKC